MSLDNNKNMLEKRFHNKIIIEISIERLCSMNKIDNFLISSSTKDIFQQGMPPGKILKKFTEFLIINFMNKSLIKRKDIKAKHLK